jgi:hypothetical protein
MREAFKEWAVVVSALATGRQIIILRKGGISEGRGGFTMDHPEFWLFPTLFHQQNDMVIGGQEDIVSIRTDESSIPIQFFARVESWKRIDSLDEALSLAGQHVWKESVIRERFDWSRRKDIHALAVRVYALPRPVIIPDSESYGGCRSWIQLDEPVSTDPATPVLNDRDFESRLGQFEKALGLHPHQGRKA